MFRLCCVFIQCILSDNAVFFFASLKESPPPPHPFLARGETSDSKCMQVNRLAERHAGRQATHRKSEQTRCSTAETDKGYVQLADIRGSVQTQAHCSCFCETVCVYSVQAISNTKRQIKKKETPAVINRGNEWEA